MASPRRTTLEQHLGAIQPYWEVFRPDGRGPFPTIIQLHGCGGQKPFMSVYADIARLAGVAVVAIDSNAPRRISRAMAYATVCTGMQLPGRERAADLFAAIAWVREQSWCDRQRLAASGWSHGGWTIVDALGFRDPAEMTRATGIEDIADEPLAGLASIFLVYPYLGPLALRERIWRLQPDVTAVLCGRDVVAGGQWPRLALARARAQGAKVNIVTFDTATHAFDDPSAVLGVLSHNPGFVARSHRLYEDFARSLISG